MRKINSVSWEEKFIEVDGIKIHYFLGGKGPVLLLIHGWPLAFHLPSRFLDIFAQNFRVFAVNLPGFGKSEIPAFPPTVENYANFLNRFIKDLGIRKHSVIGWSFGGMVAIKYTAPNSKNISKIVLCGTAVRGDHVANKLLRGVYKFLSLTYEKIPLVDYFIRAILKSDRFLPWLWERISANDPSKFSSIAALKKMPVPFQKAIFDNALKVNLEKDCRKLKNIPTLILAGEKDNLMTVKCGAEIDGLIRTSYFMIVPNARHGDILNEDSINICLDFLFGKSPYYIMPKIGSVS